MSKILKVHGLQVFDSRGIPTVSCKITLENGLSAISMAPSGARVEELFYFFSYHILVASKIFCGLCALCYVVSWLNFLISCVHLARKLLLLRSVEDVFAFVGCITNVGSREYVRVI